MTKQPRIKNLGMSMMDVMIVLADGNPGAINVMCLMVKDGQSIDPDNALGGLGNLLSLDTHGIYGPRIWMLYKDVCKQNLNRTLGLLRAVQLGYLSESKLNHGIDNYGDGLDIPALLAKVKERLPDFVMPPEETKAA